MKFKIILLFMFLTLSGCASLDATHPISTASPQATDSLQLTPIPDGFKRELISELNISVLVPDNWFYKWETQDNVQAFFVTKEDIDATGRFVTGLTVNVYHDVENIEEAAKSFIANKINLKTTTKAGDVMELTSKTQNAVLYGVDIEAEYPFDPSDPFNEKTLSYFAIAEIRTNTLYLIIFESPRNTWETEWNKFGLEITMSVVESVFNAR